MKFGRLLRILRDDILHDKSDQSGAEYSDYLWSDETLTDFINEAQRRFAVGSLCIRDHTTPEVCDFQLIAYQREYQLHPSIIAVISARLDGAKMDLARAGHSQFDTYRQPDGYFFNTDELQQYPPGAVVAYDTDEGVTADDYGSMQVMNFRAYPPPKPQYVRRVKLRVVRKPLQELSLQNPDMRPEIPDDHHMDCLSWAAYLALRIVDRDAGDAERAQEFKAQFELDVRRARDIAMRKLFTPAQWGFGRNGFSYERDGEGS
jgi:hypothetical protein